MHISPWKIAWPTNRGFLKSSICAIRMGCGSKEGVAVDHPLWTQHAPQLRGPVTALPGSLYLCLNPPPLSFWMIACNDSEGSLWVPGCCPFTFKFLHIREFPQASGLAVFVHHHLLLITHCHSNINSVILTLHPHAQNMCGKTGRRVQQQTDG